MSNKCPVCGAPDVSSEDDLYDGVQNWACGRSSHVRDSNEWACNRIAELVDIADDLEAQLLAERDA